MVSKTGPEGEAGFCSEARFADNRQAAVRLARANELVTCQADYPLVSYADLYQMAAAVSIEHAGGPKIDMKYGRKDRFRKVQTGGWTVCQIHSCKFPFDHSKLVK